MSYCLPFADVPSLRAILGVIYSHKKGITYDNQGFFYENENYIIFNIDNKKLLDTFKLYDYDPILTVSIDSGDKIFFEIILL